MQACTKEHLVTLQRVMPGSDTTLWSPLGKTRAGLPDLQVVVVARGSSSLVRVRMAFGMSLAEQIDHGRVITSVSNTSIS
jgi:hypothetical protein